jgi:hypothetical protein
MATAEQIAEVRDYVAEPGIDNGWTDAKVGEYIDREADLYLAAAAIWSAKAASYATMVNVSESGSSRSMGSLIDNALKMAKEYRAKSAESGGPEDPASQAIVLTRLVRR